jgi:hypothetical protein
MSRCAIYVSTVSRMSLSTTTICVWVRDVKLGSALQAIAGAESGGVRDFGSRVGVGAAASHFVMCRVVGG